MRHYAPRARLVLVDGQADLLAAVGCGREDVGVMLPDGWEGGAGVVYRWGGWDDGEMLARRLFSGLRELDGAGVGVIVCPVPPGRGMGAAMRDRLEKAARVG